MKNYTGSTEDKSAHKKELQEGKEQEMAQQKDVLVIGCDGDIKGKLTYSHTAIDGCGCHAVTVFLKAKKKYIYVRCHAQK